MSGNEVHLVLTSVISRTKGRRRSHPSFGFYAKTCGTGQYHDLITTSLDFIQIKPITSCTNIHIRPAGAPK